MPIPKEKILDEFKKISSFPNVVIRVNRLINDKNSTIKQIEDVVKLEPVLVSRILKMVNSSYFGLEKRIDKISRAIIYIGLKNIRNLLAVDTLRNILFSKGQTNIFSYLWLHSAAVATIAQMISQRIYGKEGEDVFLAGLFHDLGLIIEAKTMPNDFEKMILNYQNGNEKITYYESEILGFDHVKLVIPLLEEWSIPEEIVDAINIHHVDVDAILPESVGGMLLIADYIANNEKYSEIPDKKYSLVKCLVSHIKSYSTEYKTLIRDIPEQMRKVNSLYS
ncbi:MAG: HDOD domain-containing protein [Leptospiraceae bacterium]|nr:HDOD domain-containing protein [Leptospiraceae bacterium]